MASSRDLPSFASSPRFRYTVINLRIKIEFRSFIRVRLMIKQYFCIRDPRSTNLRPNWALRCCPRGHFFQINTTLFFSGRISTLNSTKDQKKTNKTETLKREKLMVNTKKNFKKSGQPQAYREPKHGKNLICIFLRCRLN